MWNRQHFGILRNSFSAHCSTRRSFNFKFNGRNNYLNLVKNNCLIKKGQPSGEVFIQLDGEQSSQNAVLHKNGKAMFFMGQKFVIEVTQCSGEEMNLVLMGLLSSNLTNQSSNIYSAVNQIPSYIYSNYNSTVNSPTAQIPIIPNQYLSQGGAYSPLMWYYPTPPISPSSYLLHSQMMQSFSTPVVLILKNAPFDISSNEIYEFLNGYDVGL